MCGRYTLTEPQDIGSILEVELPALLEPRYNVAPTDAMPIVRVREGARVCRLYRWGLIPSWAKDLRIGSSMINARSEGVATKPAFRSAFATRRCLVPSTGFIEWKRERKSRLPYWIRPTDGGLLVFAGLWEAWRDPATEQWTRSYTIITGPPSPVVEPLHDRMPVTLEPADWAAWIDPELPAEAARELLATAGTELKAVPVSTRVNTVAHDDAECLAPRAEQLGLF